MAYKSIHTSNTVEKPMKDDDDSYVDYFYDDPGAPPGTLDLEPDAPPPEIVLIDYCETAASRSHSKALTTRRMSCRAPGCAKVHAAITVGDSRRQRGWFVDGSLVRTPSRIGCRFVSVRRIHTCRPC